MARWKIAFVAAVCLPLLTACHTDPFSVKPETNATLPKKAPAATPETKPAPVDEAEEPTQ